MDMNKMYIDSIEEDKQNFDNNNLSLALDIPDQSNYRDEEV